MLVVGRCILTAVKDSGKIQTTQITVMAGETQDAVERFQEYGFTSVPLKGCEGIAVFIGGNRESAAVIATDDRRYRLKNLSSGDVAIYTNYGNFVKLKSNGDVEVEGKNIKVTAETKVELIASTVEITGSSKVDVLSGEVNVGSGANQKAVLGDLFKATFDAHTHVGNLGFNTSPPTTPMPPTNLSSVVKVK